VAEIMGERHRLGEVFVERQRPRQRRAICPTSMVWVSRVRK